MKKLLFVLSAFAALSLLAQDTDFALAADNQIGVYSEAAAGPGTQNFTVGASEQFQAYAVLTSPVNALDEAVPDVEAAEFMITFSNGGNVFKLAEILPTGAINVGDSTNPALGLDYTYGSPTPVPVVGGAVTLVEFTFLLLTADENLVYVVESRKGNIQYQQGGAGTTRIQAYPSSGDTAAPVASFNGTGVTPVEAQSWGGLKALYR